MSKTRPSTSEPNSPPQYFQDQLYTSRTLIMPDGQTLPVTGGRVAVFTDDQHSFLRDHPEFEPLSE